MNHVELPAAQQRPCTHCGACAPACPAHLQPQRLFAALAADDWAAARRGGVAACIECNACTSVCPSHIPLLDWFVWGKDAVRERRDAEAARARFEGREARLARVRDARAPRHFPATPQVPAPVRTISKAEVLAAIARGRARAGKRTRGPGP